jgi:hypothetical protein
MTEDNRKENIRAELDRAAEAIAAARQAREEILQGKAMPMNVEDL